MTSPIDKPQKPARTLKAALTRLSGLYRRFARDRRGIGAIEFAIIAPILLMLYIGALEFTIGLSVAKRVSRAAGTIADIIAQENTPTSKTGTLDLMPTVAASILDPQSINGLTLKISGIAIDATSNAKIAWSWSEDGTTPYAAGNPVTLSTDLAQPNSFLVHAELSIPYTLFNFGPDFLPGTLNQITISRDHFYRLRTGDTLACTGC